MLWYRNKVITQRVRLGVVDNRNRQSLESKKSKIFADSTLGEA